MPVFGVLARSWAMTMADPRMKANGEAIMREYRIGMRSGIRSLACASRRSIGSCRSVAGFLSAWTPLGTNRRAARPSS
jgi:hypothetical protein